MLALYVGAVEAGEKKPQPELSEPSAEEGEQARDDVEAAKGPPPSSALDEDEEAAMSSSALRSDGAQQQQSRDSRAPPNAATPDPLPPLYYNTILTGTTVLVAIVIGVLQLLGLVDSVTSPEGRFWDGVRAVQERYDAVGGAICGGFVLAGIAGVLGYKPWRRWVERKPHEQDDRTE